MRSKTKHEAQEEHEEHEERAAWEGEGRGLGGLDALPAALFLPLRGLGLGLGLGLELENRFDTRTNEPTEERSVPALFIAPKFRPRLAPSLAGLSDFS